MQQVATETTMTCVQYDNILFFITEIAFKVGSRNTEQKATFDYNV